MSERVLKFYKRWISVMFPPACRYVPTCSEYAAEAVARYGIVRGGAMAAWRFVRCNPLARGGHDPVPRGLKPALKSGMNGTAEAAPLKETTEHA